MATDQHTKEDKGIERISFGGEKMEVYATLGFITEVRIDLGFYQAKVANLITPTHERTGHSMLGQERDDKGKIIAPGAWMQFLYPADYLASHWLPQAGDRVMVLTFGSYDYKQARLLPLTTSDKKEAEAAGEMTINGRARILSGGPGIIA